MSITTSRDGGHVRVRPLELWRHDAEFRFQRLKSRLGVVNYTLIAPIAQRIERRFPKPGVDGSNPSGGLTSIVLYCGAGMISVSPGWIRFGFARLFAAMIASAVTPYNRPIA